MVVKGYGIRVQGAGLVTLLALHAMAVFKGSARFFRFGVDGITKQAGAVGIAIFLVGESVAKHLHQAMGEDYYRIGMASFEGVKDKKTAYSS